MVGEIELKHSEFNYVEIAISGLHNRNQIVKMSEIPALSGREDYQSMFRFTEDIKSYAQSHIINGKPSVSGYQGTCYTDFLWIDIDRITDNKPNLPKAFEDITYLIGRLRELYEIEPSILQVFFTGSKGFCIGIPSEMFSLEPSEHLPEICKQLAIHIAGDIGIDENVYETVRLWRLPNSINEKSGLYKIELDPDADILLGDIDDILKMAKSKRTDKIKRTELDESYIGALDYLVKDIDTGHPEGQRETKPSGEKWIVEALGGVREGDRNNTLFKLAGYLLSKHPQDIAWALLTNANNNCNPPLDDRELQTLFNSSLKKKDNSEAQDEPEPDNQQWSRSVAEMRQNPPKKKPCLIGGGVLPAYGYTMLAGKTKEGKSTLITQMCFSVIAGIAFLNKFDIERPDTRILYMNLELDEGLLYDTIDQQIDNFGVDISDKLEALRICTVKGFCLDNAKHKDKLKGEILDWQTNLVVIDPISKATMRDQNDYKAVQQVINKLDSISLDVGGISWLLLHHYAKPNESRKDTVDKLIGSSAWGNFAESIIGLERYSHTRSADYKSLAFTLRGGRKPNDMTLYHNPETRLFEVVKDAEDIPATKPDRIVSILEEAGEPLRYKDFVYLITQKLSYSDQHAKLMITKAVEAELIVKKDKRYIIHSKNKTNIL